MCHPQCRASVWESASTTNHFFEDLAYSRGCKKGMPNYVHHSLHSNPYAWCANSHHGNLINLICGLLALWYLPLPMPFSHSWVSLLAPWCVFLWIMSFHSSQITFSTASTSAPFCKRTSTTSLCPFRADINKGVASFWGIQHVQQMQTQKRGWSGNKC